MNADRHLSIVAAAIADPSRARMLCALLDGRSRTATELAAVGSISASTASTHLRKLELSRLVEYIRSGRHRYFRLSGPAAASALEALLHVSAKKLSGFQSSAPHHLRFARTCYDHAAGELAVRFHDHCLARHWLERNEDAYVLTGKGETALQKLGVSLVTSPRRRFAYPCLDWSERHFHIGGRLGAAILQTFDRKRWLTRDLDSRALRLTASGKRGFAALGVNTERAEERV